MLRQICCAILALSFAGGLHAQNLPEGINCVVVVQYPHDFTGEDEARNEDLLETAKNVTADLGKDGTTSEYGKVTGHEDGTPGTTLEAVLEAFTKGKKRCCKKIVILSHGLGNGSLLLPYHLPTSKKESRDLKHEVQLGQNESDLASQLGGKDTAGSSRGAIEDWGKEQLDKFVATVKKVSCPDQTPAVDFDGCWSATDGGIAQQVADGGVETRGYTGGCRLDPTVPEGKTRETATKEEKTWALPRPDTREGRVSEFKAFKAVLPAAKATEKPKDKPKSGGSGSGANPPESPKAPPLPPIGGSEGGVSHPTPEAPLLASASFTPIQPRPGNGTGNDQGSYLPPLAGPGSTITASVVDENEAGPRGFIVGTVDDTGKRSFFSGITDAAGHLAFVVPSGVTAIELFRHFDKNGNPSAPAHTDVGQLSHLAGTDPLPPNKIPTNGPAITEANSAIERGGPNHGTITMHTRGTDPLGTRVLIDDKPVEMYAASDTSVVAHLPDDLPLGTHQFSVSSAGMKTNAFPADVMAIHPEPIAPLRTGATTTVRVHVDGVPQGHQATMHFEVSGAARLVGGAPSVDITLNNGVASIQIQGVHSGQLIVKYQLRVSIPNYWPAPMQ